jgi:hypothetical protein
MYNIIFGIIFGIIAQVGTFLQLQGNIKYGWFDKYPIIILLSSIPIGYFYIKSVQHFVIGFSGELWPSRLIGFVVGIFVFSIMSITLFKEPITLKTVICLFLAIIILLIQLFMK